MAWRAVCSKHGKRTKQEYYGHNRDMFCSQPYKDDLQRQCEMHAYYLQLAQN
jgi:hypothetical protein